MNYCLGKISFSLLSCNRKTLESSEVLISSSGSAQISLHSICMALAIFSANTGTWVPAWYSRWLLQPPFLTGELEEHSEAQRAIPQYTECEMRMVKLLSPWHRVGKMSPLSRNRLFKCLKMQGKVGEAEYEIICAMATNTCNPSFPRLQIQVLMPWSCMTWIWRATPLRSPKSFFWGCFTWITEQYFLFFHFHLPIRITRMSCPKPQTLMGPKWHYSPQLSLWWSQAGFHKESKTNNF